MNAYSDVIITFTQHTSSTDIDECLNNPCGANATCTNSPPGSHTCTCNTGFSGDGISCTGKGGLFQRHILDYALFLFNCFS